jgi:hypothetical protein
LGPVAVKRACVCMPGGRLRAKCRSPVACRCVCAALQWILDFVVCNGGGIVLGTWTLKCVCCGWRTTLPPPSCFRLVASSRHRCKGLGWACGRVGKERLLTLALLRSCHKRQRVAWMRGFCCRKLEAQQYNWRGLNEYDSLSGKIRRGIAQFTPYNWTVYHWGVLKSFKRFLYVVALVVVILVRGGHAALPPSLQRASACGVPCCAVRAPPVLLCVRERSLRMRWATQPCANLCWSRPWVM